MGYCVDWDVKMLVPKRNIKKALEAINELMKPEVVAKKGRGGSWSGGKQTGVWYSWVENPPNNRYETLKDAFDGWGFNATMIDGDLVVNYCENEKLGQEELFLEVIAPYVDPNGYVMGRGEDGAVWRWVFKNKHLVEQQGKLIFEEE